MKFSFFFTIASVCSILFGHGHAFLTNDALALVGATGVTHADMTGCALNKIAMDFLNSNSSDKRNSCPTMSDVMTVCNQIVNRNCADYPAVHAAIIEANVLVDKFEANSAKAHFLSETFYDANQALIDMKKSAILAMTSKFPGDYFTARLAVGRLLHTLQDFYAHSNWVELGNTLPHPGLARNNAKFSNLAKPDEVTCIDCLPINCANICIQTMMICQEICHFPGEGCKTELGFEICAPVFNCTNNLVTNRLTSAYYYSSSYNNNNNDSGTLPTKPIGKCSHGDPSDVSSNLPAIGGINKDSNWPVISPHYYLHEKAANLAQIATIEFFQDLARLVGQWHFGQFLGITSTTQPSPRPVAKSDFIDSDVIRLTIGTVETKPRFGFFPIEGEPICGSNVSIMVEKSDKNVTAATLINERGEIIASSLFRLIAKTGQSEAQFVVPMVPFRIRIDGQVQPRLYRPSDFEILPHGKIFVLHPDLVKTVDFTVKCYNELQLSSIIVTAQDTANFTSSYQLDQKTAIFRVHLLAKITGISTLTVTGRTPTSSANYATCKIFVTKNRQ